MMKKTGNQFYESPETEMLSLATENFYCTGGAGGSGEGGGGDTDDDE